jgi:hypothetical protein
MTVEQTTQVLDNLAHCAQRMSGLLLLIPLARSAAGRMNRELP